MRETFAAVCLIALVASGVGLWGLWRHEAADINLALSALPGQDSSELAETSGHVLEALFGVHGPVGPDGGELPDPAPVTAGQHLERLGELSERYLAYRERSFSPSVQPIVRQVCAEPNDAWVPQSCIRQTREALVALRAERERSAVLYRQVLGWSRVLWAIAFLIALLLVFRGYNEIRIEARRRSRPLPREPLA